MSFAAKVTLALALSVAILGASSVDSYRTIERLVEDAREETAAQAGIALSEEILNRLDFTEDALIEYLGTGGAAQLRQYERGSSQVMEIVGKLGQVKDPRHAVNVHRLRTAIKALLDSYEAARRERETIGAYSFSTQRQSYWRDAVRTIDSLVQAVKSDFRHASSSRQASAVSGKVAKTMILWGGLISLVLLVSAAATLVVYERRRQRAVDKLRDSEAMSRAVTESMADGVIVAQMDGTIVSANRAAVEMLGYRDESELARLHATDCVPERQRADFRILLDMLAAREPNFRETGFETRGMRKNGAEFPAVVSFGDVFVGGERLITTIFRDVTVRKRMNDALRDRESQLRQVTDAVPALIYYADADRRVRFHNRLMNEWFGREPRDIDGRSVCELVGPEAYEIVGPKVDQVLRGYPVGYERRFRTADGNFKDMAVHYYPRYDESDPSHPVLGYFALMTDITELRRIDRMKSEFVATVSHELRTPLTSIRGSLGLLSGGVGGDLPAPARSLIGIAQNNCDRLIRLVNDILDSEKIESGKMAFDLETLAMKPLLDQALAANEGFAAQHRVSLRLGAPSTPILAHVDADRLAQVVTNLVSNAVKFSPAGSTVEVSLRSDAGRVRVEVRDRGPGIPEAFRARVFQRFSQADASDARPKGGTGLGLNISRAIVERLGGVIGFNTEVGDGTTFFFDLPEVAPGALDERVLGRAA
jgi:PAS domain S-box-containing protein